MNTYERLGVLLDDGTFREASSSPETLFVTGEGEIDGRPVYVIAGRAEGIYAEKVLLANLGEETAFFRQAAGAKQPLVFIHDNPTGPLGKSTPILRNQARLLLERNALGASYCNYARLAGKMPTVSVVLGRISSSQTFHTVMSDVTVMAKQAGLCMGRPDMVREVLGEDIFFEELAGPVNHSEISGIVGKVCDTEEECLLWARQYLSYFPPAPELPPPVCPSLEPRASDAESILAVDGSVGLDVKRLIDTIVDRNTFLELYEAYAPEVVVGLSRIGGRSVGIVANNSHIKGGVLFAATCKKISRFVALCDSYRIPLLFLADVPGFMIGSDAEKSGIIGAGAELYKTIAKSTVAKVSIVIRKAYTGGVFAMAGGGFDPAGFFALPGAALGIFSRETIERLADGRQCSEDEKRIIEDLRQENANPQLLVDQGLLDGVISPAAIRPTAIASLFGRSDP
jgi:acetyl-CoA carboxylase carboxyltransferase component